ncbi:PREDICTED: uncharacterized protein LOC105315218 [Amphimedon queenslandica]|uniref:Death domain-containing protein n=1 Tax=Amphimedon queenslandica TaxID=400682 RepID=A0AAN0IR30_AMPQE|nr:PREDICTED: uncharacterized protein LOC105315218 [Amphimedon queenslandica]|eukprot:XP_011408079.1 PREDICTED: uncharacterized protein LOC105315218 [Amphimedon queenslandica]
MNAILVLFLLFKVTVSIPDPDGKLHIYALPVGQGDCTVIQCPEADPEYPKGRVTIIDAGASNNRGIDAEVGIKEHEILKIEKENVTIEDKKLALYLKWLSVNPKATWRDVIDALTSRNQNKLAQDIKEHIDIDSLSTLSSLSPKTSYSDGDTEIIFFPKEDQTVQDSLDDLQINFSHIMKEVKLAFRGKTVQNSRQSIEISNWVESYLHWEYGTIDNDLDDIFKKIHHNYDFIDCSLIVAMCNEFISDERDLLDELKAYSLKANAFRSSRPITELKQKLRKVYGPFRRQLENMPLICIELQNPWNDVKINGLYILIKKLLPIELRQSIMKCITIESGSVVIKLHILDFTADTNANPHLKTSIGSNAVMIASYDGSYKAVDLLISKGVDYKYQREDGANALMVACQNGYTQIVELLLNKQVDPNVQEKDGVNAFINDKANAFTLACQNGRTKVVELLLKNQVNPNVDGWNTFMLACKNGHTEIAELLLKEHVDPNVQEKNGVNAFMLASATGHTQIIELLLREQVDPNIQEKNGERVNPNVQASDGVNAFMLACQNGHTQIVELLLKEQVDPNVQNKQGHTDLIAASCKGHS